VTDETVALYLHGSPPDGLRSKSWRQNAKKSLTLCGLATFVLMGCGERGDYKNLQKVYIEKVRSGGKNVGDGSR